MHVSVARECEFVAAKRERESVAMEGGTRYRFSNRPCPCQHLSFACHLSWLPWEMEPGRPRMSSLWISGVGAGAGRMVSPSATGTGKSN
jgi:hypothetical protein